MSSDPSGLPCIKHGEDTGGWNADELTGKTSLEKGVRC